MLVNKNQLQPNGNPNWQPNGNPNSKTILLEYKEVKFITKEEVASQWQVKKDTFQKWLAKLPPQEDEVKTQENTGKKLFKESYVLKLIEKFRKSQSPNPSQIDTNNSSMATLYQEIIDAKNETIKILGARVVKLETDLASQLTTQIQPQLTTQKELAEHYKKLEILASQWQVSILELENKKKDQNQLQLNQNQDQN